MSRPIRTVEPANPWPARWLALGVFAITLAVYWPVHDQGFLPLDDRDYVADNPHVARGLSLEGIGWAFTHFHSANWHPLTWISHMLDCELWGLNPGPSHLVNAGLHAASAALLCLLLNWMTNAAWRSALVAALFAWHPLHVQSVAWIAERKDVLSAFFWMLTLSAYVWYVRQPSRRRMAAVVVCYALGLMAKPMLVSLPFVLLLLDYWPLGRLQTAAQGTAPKRWMALTVEKLPLFVLFVASCVVTLSAQQQGGAIVPVDHLPLSMRLENAAVSYVGYLWKTIWPRDLAIYYPYGSAIEGWQVALASLLLAGVTVLAVVGLRRRPFLAVGWGWYMVTLLPVIGIVQVGGQPMADRYTYLPLVGIFVAVIWVSAELLARPQGGRLAGSICGAAIAGLALFGTVRELRHWSTADSLFRRALVAGGESAGAHSSLGIDLLDRGLAAEAVEEFSAALRIAPRNAGAHLSLANALMSLKRNDDAIDHFQQALLTSPNDPRIHNNLGSAFLRLKRFDEALSEYEEAVRLDPEQAESQFNLAGCLVHKGLRDEAITHLERALRLQPDHAEANNNLGALLTEQGKYQEALAHLGTALATKPDYVSAHVNIGNALVAVSSTRQALTHYQEALRLNPMCLPAMREIAWIRASSPNPEFLNGAEAVRVAERAAKLTGERDASVLDALAAAYAEAGRPSDAVAMANKAHDLAVSSKQTQLAGAIEDRLRLYGAGKPYRRSK